MTLVLTPEQEWTLRYWNAVHRQPEAKGTMANTVAVAGTWKKPTDVKLRGEPPTDYHALYDVLDRLIDYGFVKIPHSDSDGLEYTVTKAGLEALSAIDNPDYFATIVQWACRNPYVACGMIVVITLGTLGGLINLVDRVIALFK